ncbi:MAG: hypothetical protein ACRDPX_02270 [Gaiellaceae bacterium]
MTGTFRQALLFGAGVASTLAIGIGVGIAQAADPRLDTADAALVQAKNLLLASETCCVTERAEKQFHKAVGDAIGHIDDARADIVKAKTAVDGDQ